MKEIDHNPHERRETNGIWWVLWPIVILGWISSFWFGLIQWHSVALGAFSGLVLATWAIEITGNKIPDSWRSKTPRS